MERRKILFGGGAALTTVLAGCAGGNDDDPEPVDDDGGNGGSDSGDDGDETETAGNDDETGDDETGDDESATDEPGEEPVETIEDVVGSLIEGRNIHLVVEGVRYTTELGAFTEADDGSEFVVVSLAMKNVSEEFLSVSNLLQTSLRDDENYLYSQTYASGDEQTFNDGQFAPGELERGVVVFEIPDDASGLELQFDFDVSIFGGVDRAHIDLESETDVYELVQDLQIDVYDVEETIGFQDTEVTVNDVRYETALGQFAEAEEGNEYAIIDIEITNNTGEQQYISTILQMLVKDEHGTSYQEDLGATSELDRSFDEGSALEDGETRRGEVAYEVDVGRSPLYWVFEFGVWTDGDKTFWRLR